MQLDKDKRTLLVLSYLETENSVIAKKCYRKDLLGREQALAGRF